MEIARSVGGDPSTALAILRLLREDLGSAMEALYVFSHHSVNTLADAESAQSAHLAIAPESRRLCGIKRASVVVSLGMRSDESRLVHDARGGSQKALEELFDRYWEPVWRASYAVTGRRDLADDVAQDAFVCAIASLDTFVDGRPFGPWITRIGVNRAIDVVRQDSRHVHVAAELAERACADDRDWELIRTVRELDDDRRAIIVLHYWVDLTIREIGEILQIPTGTVTSRLSRALDELRASLEEPHEYRN